jgi:hypothetical protein
VTAFIRYIWSTSAAYFYIRHAFYFHSRGQVTWERRKLHNEKLHDLYSSSTDVQVTKSKGIRWAGHLARMVEGRGVHRVLMWKPEGKRPLGRPSRRLEDNIKIALQEVGFGA